MLGGRLGTFDAVALPVILLTAFLVGLFGSSYPVAARIVGTFVGLAFVITSLTRGSPRQRLLRLLRVVVYCGLGVIFGSTYARLGSGPGRTAQQLSLALLLLLGLVGVMVEWRSRRLGRSLPWILPVVLSLTGSFVLAMGYIAQWGYTAELGLPYGALSADTFGYIVAGLLPAAWAAAVFLTVVAMYGLVRWLFGSQVVSGFLMGVSALIGVFTALLWVLQDADRKAEDLGRAVASGSSDALPYFSLIEPAYVCVSLVSPDTAIEGGSIADDGRPWVLLGHADGRYVLWRSVDDYRMVAVEALSTAPASPKAACSS